MEKEAPIKAKLNRDQFIDRAKSYLPTATLGQAGVFYKNLLQKQYDPELLRELAKADRWFLLCIILGRKDAVHPWLYQRCREVEATPDGVLDLWARGHYKSTIITYAGTIQEILRNPNTTIGIFSHTRPIAKGFLKQIKREFEVNEFLRELFPDICYPNPRQDSPQWSEDAGIIVKRKSNPKEATVEAWGLVDGQPISRHYDLRIYDDVVTRDSVNTPDQIAKTTEALDLSQNLSGGQNREWYIGTRYHYADTYRDLIERGTETRVYPATDSGAPDGNPILLSEDEWEKKKSSMGIMVVKVGYERYGKDSDIEHFKEMMRIENSHFPIEELAWPREGPGSKRDRVQRLQPDFENWRFFLAPSSDQLTSRQRKAFEVGDAALIVRPLKQKDETGRLYDVTQRMIDNEYNLFPAVHVDMLDAMSRIYDIQAAPPQLLNSDDLEPDALPSY